MASNINNLIDQVCSLIAQKITPERIEIARRRQADMLAGRTSDYIPIVFGKAVQETKKLPEFNWAEQFHDPAKSLYMQLKDIVLPAVCSDSDNVPGVRADTGVVNCMSVFGVGYSVPEHTKPVVTTFPTKESLEEFEVPEDISQSGILPKVKEHMEHHIKVLDEHGLGDLVNVHHCDTQGPFDIAAQTRGHDIFMDLFDDQDFVHSLMRRCTEVYIKVSVFCKEINNEFSRAGSASGYWMEKGAVRMCGDSDILLNSELHRQFALPYQQEAFNALGGGWLHYCGGMPGYNRAEGLHLHENYAATEGLWGLNFTTARDWPAELQKLNDLSLTYIGMFPRLENEPLEEYFKRLIEIYDNRQGLIFSAPDLKDEEFGIAMDCWRKVQDEFF